MLGAVLQGKLLAKTSGTFNFWNVPPTGPGLCDNDDDDDDERLEGRCST